MQPAPAKRVTVADIAKEAEARRAVATKTTLNCIVVTRRSFYKAEKNVSELDIIPQDNKQEAREGLRC